MKMSERCSSSRRFGFRHSIHLNGSDARRIRVPLLPFPSPSLSSSSLVEISDPLTAHSLLSDQRRDAPPTVWRDATGFRKEPSATRDAFTAD